MAAMSFVQNDSWVWLKTINRSSDGGSDDDDDDTM